MSIPSIHKQLTCGWGSGTSILESFSIESSLTIWSCCKDIHIPAISAMYSNYFRPVRDYLDETFPYRWISGRGTIESLARSADLNLVNLFLWGYLKSKVYFKNSLILKKCETNYVMKFKKMFSNVLRDFPCCPEHCQIDNDRQVEHLIKKI